MKLNPKRCTFKVEAKKFWGYMVFQRGVEANIEKTQAILDMPSLRSVKDIQKLVGRITALS